MGVDFVVWHTPADEKKGENVQWTAQIDACTHRLAPLSQGRVDPNTKCIECPYHGWQFDKDGTITSIPQLEDTNSIRKFQETDGNVQTFPIHVVGDVIFVFLPTSMHGEMFPQSILPEEYYPTLSTITEDASKQFFVRDLPYSFDFLVENFMDPAHIPFAHHKLQGTRDDATPIEMAELVSNFTHVELSFKDITGKRKRDAYASFQRPSLYHFGEYKDKIRIDEATGKMGRVPGLNILCVPVEAGRSRLFIPPFPIKIPLPTFLLHAGSNRFLNTDIWLHNTEREAARRKSLCKSSSSTATSRKLAGLDYTYASQSDLGVSAFRKWWKKHGMSDAPANTFSMATSEQLRQSRPDALARKEQIDPWENHAKHCSSCRRDLKKLKRGQHFLFFFAITATAFIRRSPAASVAGAGLGLCGYHFLKRLATVIEGNPERSGVNDRSVSASA
mmetsp:Transcript_6608/g.9682  ORF Transcript_6608/g.9682 Transcript_6608/m.9682 type:complete len:446 (+) Transcript_6608:3-1340(+)